MATRATLFDPVTGKREAVEIGSARERELFAAGSKLETPTQNFQTYKNPTKEIQQVPGSPNLYASDTQAKIQNPAQLSQMVNTGGYMDTRSLFTGTPAPVPGTGGSPSGTGGGTSGGSTSSGTTSGTRVNPYQSFNDAIAQLLLNAKNGTGSADLMAQRNALINARFNAKTDVTPEALRVLTPDQQAALRSGEVSGLNTQLGGVNAAISTRQEEYKTALDLIDRANEYAKQGYQMSQQEKKDALQANQWMITNFGSAYIESLGPEDQANVEKSLGIPNGSLDKLGKSLKEQELAAKATTPVGAMTANQLFDNAMKLMSERPFDYPDLASAMAAVTAQFGVGGNQPLGASNGSNVVGGFDIGTYATDPNHERSVQGILNRIGQFPDLLSVDYYIKNKYPNSPITGQMISNASSQYGVPWEMLVAMMEQDSSLGTAGKGARTFNPGNVGNDDAGNIRNYGNWQSGVNAVADWLSKHRASDSPTPQGNDQTTRLLFQVQHATAGMAVNTQKQAINEIRSLVNSGDIAGAQSAITGYAVDGLKGDAQKSYYENNSAIQSAEIAAGLLNDPNLAVGPYKVLLEDKKPYALMATDPRFAQFRFFTNLSAASLRRAFFGTAVTDNEQTSAAGFLPNQNDDFNQLKTKLEMLPKVLQFANDAKIAYKTGQPPPKMTDYVDLNVLNKTPLNQTLSNFQSSAGTLDPMGIR